MPRGSLFECISRDRDGNLKWHKRYFQRLLVIISQSAEGVPTMCRFLMFILVWSDLHLWTCLCCGKALSAPACFLFVFAQTCIPMHHRMPFNVPWPTFKEISTALPWCTMDGHCIGRPGLSTVTQFSMHVPQDLLNLSRSSFAVQS